MKRFINPVPQFLKNNGDLSSYGKLYFLQEGSDNLSDTISIYSSPDGGTELTNPVTLTGEGRITSVFGEGRCRVKNYDAAGVLQWSRDYDFTADSSQFDLWNSQKTYSINDIARGDDGGYYISQTNDNKGNDPTSVSSSAEWSKIALIEFWNADKLGGYANDAVVIHEGKLYSSNVSANTTEPPSASWDDISFNNSVVGDFDVSGNTDTATLTLGNSVSTDPLKLDWYHEGVSFTPTIFGGSTAGVGTYTSQAGRYTRIGNVVFFTLSVVWTAHTGTGTFNVGGLPFTSANFPYPYALVSVSYSNITVGAGLQLCGKIVNNATSIYMEFCNPAGGIPTSTIDTAGTIELSGFYFV